MFRSLCDWWWVLFAYLGGKVLRIKKYRPICNQYNSGMDLVRWSFPITAGRAIKLMKLWGYRAATLEEGEEMLKFSVSDKVPYLEQSNERKYNFDWLKDDGWPNNGFLPVRK
jgi:hypothetical protein